MEPFTHLNGLVVPIDHANVDTDIIIPKQYLKSIERTGFGPTLFDDWRYLDEGYPGQDHSLRPLNHDFVLNQPRYQGAQILLTRENFGCGSSREHAAWALVDFGFRVIIAPSFADIFVSNCAKNGLLTVTLDAKTVDRLFQETVAHPGYRLTVDLVEQTITLPSGEGIGFEVDPHRRYMLLNGLDEIGLSLEHLPAIEGFEATHSTTRPWVFSPPPATDAAI